MIIVDFGKYKGQEVSKLPLEYLVWGMINLKTKWRKIFYEAYHNKLQPCDYKYRVFRDNLAMNAFSGKLDIYQALMLYSREWESEKYTIRELENECLIFPDYLPNHKKIILIEELMNYSNGNDDDNHGDDYDEWMINEINSIF
ncbi:MAG: hypothetical protein ACKPKK_23130 [Dolichospermum sp.]